MIEWSAMNYIMRIENYRSIGEIAYDFEAEGSSNICYHGFIGFLKDTLFCLCCCFFNYKTDR